MKRLLIMVMILGWVGWVEGANPLFNSSFEIGPTGWWYTSASPSAFTPTTEDAYTGTHSMKIDWTAASAMILQSMPFRLLPNTAYTFSGRYKRGAGWTGSHSVRTSVKSLDHQVGYSTTSLYITPAAGDWAQWKLDFTTPATLEWYYLSIVANNADCEPCVAYLDDMNIELDTDTPAWTPMANVEVGITTTKVDNIFTTADTFSFIANMRNDSGGEQTAVLEWEIWNHWNTKVGSGTSSRTIANATTDTLTITPSPAITTTGHYRIYAWMQGVKDSQSEANFTILPVPQNTATLDGESFMGVHTITRLPRDFERASQVGAKFNRLMNNESRWSIVEPSTRGVFTAWDANIPSLDTYKILGFMVLGIDRSTTPTWAYTSSNALAWADANPDTITLASGGLSAKFSAGDKVLVQCYNSASGLPITYSNNSIYLIGNVSDTVLTLDAAEALTTTDNCVGTSPTVQLLNYTAYLEYVTASVNQYTNIEYWGVWNEPTNTFSSSVYAKLSDGTKATILAAHADAKVVGFGGTNLYAAANTWTHEVVDAVTTEPDYLEVHSYPSEQQMRSGGTDGASRDSITYYGTDHSVDIWNTETGPRSAPSYVSFPMEKYVDSSAGIVGEPTRNHYDHVSMMLAINFFYQMSDWGSATSHGSKWFYYQLTKHISTEWVGWYGLNNYYTLKPLISVYAFLAKTFDKAQAVGKRVGISLVTDIQSSGPWLDKDGVVVVPVWTVDADGLTQVLKTYTTPEAVAVYDIYGGLISSSTTSVAIGPTPVILKALAAGDGRAAWITSLSTAGNFAVRTDITPPRLMVSYAPRGQLTAGDNIRFRWMAVDPDAVCDGTSALAQDRVLYSWKLDGVDAAYTTWAATNSAYYDGVGAGTYTFRVMAKDEAGNIQYITITDGEDATVRGVHFTLQ
jgi:hypothetical protein